MKRQLVVIGNGMAAMRTVEELLRLDADLYQITVFGSEPYGNYNRIQLSPVLAGEMQLSEIMLHDLEWYRAHQIKLYAGCTVQAIDRLNRRVLADNGLSVPYDRLLIATGSSPFIPAVPGTELEGIVSYRDISDIDQMIAAASTFSDAVVVGGGLLGLEAAAGLARRGMKVTVLHLMAWLMERQLDPQSAQVVQESLEARGLSFILSAKTSAFLADENGRVRAVQLSDGREIAAALVVLAVGIRPRIALAQAAGLHCQRGIVVNDTMQTFDPRIYAVGECAEHRGIAYGLVAPLYEQATVCANHLAMHGIGRYLGSVTATRLKVTGIEVFSAGEFALDHGTEDVILHDPEARVYKRAVIRDDRLVGAVLVGDTATAGWMTRLLASQERIGEQRDHLLFAPLPTDGAASEARAVV